MRDNPKIMTVADLLPVLIDAREKGARIVFTNGCFDLLHVGHTRYLQAARSCGDILVVAVNSDASVEAQGKGPGRPILPACQRIELLAALAAVDYVLLFDDPTPLRLIQQLQPDILVKGEDWLPDQIVGRDLVEGRGGRVVRVPLTPGMSTTALITRILRAAGTDRPARPGQSSEEVPLRLP